MRALIDFCAPDTDQATPLRGAFATPRQTLVAHTLAQVRPLLDLYRSLHTVL